MFNYICLDGQRASGGTSIMVKSSVPHSQFDLNTNLQAVAVNVTLSKKVTICSIYLPPSDTLSKNSLVNLIDQLPHPFMLVVVVVVALLFYVHGKRLRSCRDGQLT